MFIIKYRKIFYTFSFVLLVASIFSIAFWGLKPGIDFAGGSLLDVSFASTTPTVAQVSNNLKQVGFENASIRSSSDGFFISLREITPSEKENILNAISINGIYTPVVKSFSSVGPILGKEALQKSWISIVLVLLAIVLFVAFAFRKVSRPISSWVYGVVTVLALMHDVLVPTGIFSILGHFYGFEIDTLFVTALLVILGFSVHDTIVVFDRVRENLQLNDGRQGKSFDQIVGESVSQTFIRSINTSLTTLLAILALYLFGPETTKHFALTLLIGISVGTYSSIFIGSPLLVTINNWKKADFR